MEQTELQKEWELRIADYKASGLTQSKWCEENNLTLHQFKYWFYKIERKKTSSQKSNWVSVTLDENTQDMSETLRIKIGQASIEVKPGFNPSLLADVIKVLKTVC
jgi:hypothetical protein